MDNELTKDIARIVDERSVVLRTEQGRERIFAHKNMLDVTKRPNHRFHEFLKLSDLIAYAIENGSKASACFYNKQGVILILDETWMENKSHFDFEPSDAVKRWIFNPSTQQPMFTQERLIEFLECWSNEVTPEGVDLQTVIGRLINLQLSAKITYDRRYDDQNNIKLNYSVEEKGSQTAVLPKKWTLIIPIFDGSKSVGVPVNLRYNVPKREEEQPVFYFECPTLSALIEDEVDKSCLVLVDGLKGSDIPVYKGIPQV